MTTDHIFPLWESEDDSRLFCQAASALARGEIPEEILSGFRLGRLTALRKPDGGVRGIVVGEILRRLIARSIAKQMAKSVEAATLPDQSPSKCYCSLPVHPVYQGRMRVCRSHLADTHRSGWSGHCFVH